MAGVRMCAYASGITSPPAVLGERSQHRLCCDLCVTALQRLADCFMRLPALRVQPGQRHAWACWGRAAVPVCGSSQQELCRMSWSHSRGLQTDLLASWSTGIKGPKLEQRHAWACWGRAVVTVCAAAASKSCAVCLAATCPLAGHGRQA